MRHRSRGQCLRGAGRPRTRASGFTLLELLIAVTLMSVLALMSWRALDSLIDARERITRSSDDLRELVVAFAQIEEDLRRAWPIRLIDTGRQSVLLQMAAGGSDSSTGGELDLLREAPAVAALALNGSAAGDPSRLSGIQRVIWRLDRGQLQRGFITWWPGSPDALALFSDQQSSRTDGMIWQRVAAGFESVAWRAYVPGRGWFSPGQRVDDVAAQVTGVEIALIRGGERIVRVFSVRD